MSLCGWGGCSDVCAYCIDHWADVLLVSLYAWDEHVHKMLYHLLAYADVDVDADADADVDVDER